jgi:hypothetical protein
MTSLEQERGEPVVMADLYQTVQKSFEDVFGFSMEQGNPIPLMGKQPVEDNA